MAIDQPADIPTLFKSAKADGRWARAYGGARTFEVPQDLSTALDAALSAKASFSTINGASRYAVLWRIQAAVNARDAGQVNLSLVEMLRRGETMRIFKPKGSDIV